MISCKTEVLFLYLWKRLVFWTVLKINIIDNISLQVAVILDQANMAETTDLKVNTLEVVVSAWTEVVTTHQVQQP